MKLPHPIEEIKEVSMYVWKLYSTHSYIFVIPFHNWSYLVNDTKEINLNIPAPSSFRYEKYKLQLINAMNEGIKKINKGLHIVKSS